MMKFLVKRYLNETKIRSKIMIAYVLFSLLPILIFCLISYTNWYEIFINNALSKSYSSFEQVNITVANDVKNIYEMIEIIANDKRINSILRKVSAQSYEMEEQIKDYKETSDFLKNMQNGKDIFRIRLYLPSEFYFSQENDVFCDFKNAPCEKLYNKLRAVNEMQAFDLTDRTTDTNTPVISTMRLISDPNNYNKIRAMLKVEILADSLVELLKDYAGDNMVFIMDEENHIIASQENYQPLVGDMKVNTWEKSNGGYMMKKNIPLTTWSMYYGVPTNSINNMLMGQTLKMLLLLLLISGMSTLAAYVISFHSVKRINLLTEKVCRVQEGNLDVEQSDMGNDEVGILNINFHSMLSKLKELMKQQHDLGQEVKKTELRAAKAELNALQSQIKPHFLYNTLEFINWQAIYDNNPLLERMVKSLSRFYKLSLLNGDGLVTIENEIQHVLSYAEIQELRYENKIKILVNMEEVLNYHIPKITIQPLVENAIQYGILRNKDAKGYIEITGKKEGELITIMVKDDGAGMSPEKVEEINKFDPMQEGGIGIKNVNERIKLYFGKQYGLVLESTQGVGTTVTITLPALKND